MTLPVGKGLFIWQGKTVGTPAAVIDRAKAMGLGWIAPKVADGKWLAWATYPDTEFRTLVELAHKAGIQVWGWQYIYGGIRINKQGVILHGYESPAEEARVAGQQIRKFGLDGFLVDAEREYKITGTTAARAYMTTLRSELPSLSIGVTSYRFPTLHMDFPWEGFLPYVNFHAPQVYWGNYDKAPVLELNRSVKELKNLANLPFIPMGRAYVGDGHADPAPAELTAFLGRCVEYQTSGAGFWSMDHLITHPGGAARQAAIANFIWPGSIPPPAPVSLEIWAAEIDTWARRNGYTGPRIQY